MTSGVGFKDSRPFPLPPDLPQNETPLLQVRITCRGHLRGKNLQACGMPHELEDWEQAYSLAWAEASALVEQPSRSFCFRT